MKWLLALACSLLLVAPALAKSCAVYDQNGTLKGYMRSVFYALLVVQLLSAPAYAGDSFGTPADGSNAAHMQPGVEYTEQQLKEMNPGKIVPGVEYTPEEMAQFKKQGRITHFSKQPKAQTVQRAQPKAQVYAVYQNGELIGYVDNQGHSVMVPSRRRPTSYHSTPKRHTARHGKVDPWTGNYLAPSGNGLVDTWNGDYYSKSGNGYINTWTGEYVPGD